MTLGTSTKLHLKSELKVSEAWYEDLLSEADGYYPKYLEVLRPLLG
jgi:intergrase/recombinase